MLSREEKAKLCELAAEPLSAEDLVSVEDQIAIAAIQRRMLQAKIERLYGLLDVAKAQVVRRRTKDVCAFHDTEMY